MPALIHCVYCSAADGGFTVPDFEKLLLEARDHNNRHALTGMLLYAEGTFFQVLEGQAEVVDALYAKIESDARHTNVTRIMHEPIPRRSFDMWTMGFSSVSRHDLATIVGGNDFFGEARCFADLDPGRARMLLKAFRDGRWRKRLSGAHDRAAI
jgi:hypothetical protein